MAQHAERSKTGQMLLFLSCGLSLLSSCATSSASRQQTPQKDLSQHPAFDSQGVGDTASIGGAPPSADRSTASEFDSKEAGLALPSTATRSHIIATFASGGLTHAAPDLAATGTRAHLFRSERYDIPVIDRPEVERWVQYFSGSGASRFSVWLERLAHYQPLMQAILREYDLPDDTIYLALIESGLSSRAYSHAHASGFWQFIEATGRAYGLKQDFWVDERRDPVKATRAAASHLRDLYHEFGSWPLAWAAYNAGSGKIRTAIRRYGSRDFFELTAHGYLRPETCDYVPKLMAAAIVAKNADAFGLRPSANVTPFAADPMIVDDATDLGLIARGCGSRMEALVQLNPELRRWATPPRTAAQPQYELRVPAGRAERCTKALEAIPRGKRLTFRHHRVRSGEVLGRISGRYGISLKALMQLNKIRDARRLSVGRDLIIPIPAHVPERVYRRSKVAMRSSVEVKKRTRSAKKRLRVAMATPLAAPEGAERVVHVVVAGDSLWSIGRRYQVPVSKLRRWNGLRKRKALQLGQRLMVYVVRN